MPDFAAVTGVGGGYVIFPGLFGMNGFKALLLAGLMLLTAASGHAARNSYTEGLSAYRAGNYAKAYKTLLPLAKKKDARAAYLIGLMYETGHGVARDTPMATAWYQASVDSGGYAPSQYNLGRMILEGRGIGQSRERAAALIAAAARQGHKEAVALLARLEPKDLPASASLSDGKAKTEMLVAAGIAAPASSPAPDALPVLNRDVAKAASAALRASLRRLAIDDDATARQALPALMSAAVKQYWLAEAVNDRAVMNDFSAVLLDHPTGVNRVARMLDAGNAAEAQAATGLLASLRAASNAGAQAGVPTGVLTSAGAPGADGCAAYVKAARAAFAYAWFYAAHCIAREDAAQARTWMQLAANAGHAGAQELQGRACLEAEEKAWACAINWLGKAAGAGRVSSMAYLGWALSNQPGASEADQRAALRWYEDAAGKGDIPAQNNLGTLLERGPAAVRNETGARFWYAAAARAGFGPAQYNLARLMIEGSGGPADRQGALEWLRKADAAGVREAKAAIDALGR